MSTKIYNGFILDDGIDIHQLARDTRTKFKPLLKKQLNERFMKELVSANDNAFFNETTTRIFRKENDLSEDYEIETSDLIKHARNKVESHLEDYSGDFQVKLAFAPDPLTGKMLGYFMGSPENFELFLDETKGVSEFHCQNSTDGPAEISEEDWNARRDMWNRVLPKGNIYTEMMISTTLEEWEMSALWLVPEEAEKMGVEFPSFADRVEKLAEELAITEYIFNHRKSNDDDPSRFMELYRKGAQDNERREKWRVSLEEGLDVGLDYESFK